MDHPIRMLPSPYRDPTAKEAIRRMEQDGASKRLQKTVAQHRQRQSERARNPYPILIDDPPASGVYVEVRDASYGDSDSGDTLLQRVQAPLFGRVILTMHEGRLTKVDVEAGVKV